MKNELNTCNDDVVEIHCDTMERVKTGQRWRQRLINDPQLLLDAPTLAGCVLLNLVCLRKVSENTNDKVTAAGGFSIGPGDCSLGKAA